MKIPVRIFHYDIARGAYLTPEYFVRAVRLAAASGFTHFLPYIENMIRLPSMVKACPACAYTQEQWREFELAARDAGIELVPHFNVIGHTDAVGRAYPELSAGSGEGLIGVDVTQESVRAWTVRCLEEFCSFSKSEYFLIGGDEWQPSDQQLTDPGFNPARIWSDQINLACGCLVSLGRIPIVWHDMLAHYPEALDMVSRDAVIGYWFYDEDSDYPFLGLLKERGFKTIMTSGTCSGLISRRIKRAVECAMKAADRHAADGFMMTSWENTPWEKLSMTIPATGALLRGGEIPEMILDTASTLESVEKLPGESRFGRACRDRLNTCLTGKVWTPYPEFHEYLTAVVTDDPDRERKSFLRYHCAEGPLLERIGVKRPACINETGDQQTVPVRRSEKPQLLVEEKDNEGPVLRFINRDETFVIYPRFGGTLQDWRVGSAVVTHDLPRFIGKKIPPPGGFYSYGGVGGFRPIWAFGTHNLPCILWQGPFTWKITVESEDMVAVELTRKMYHVDVRYTVTVRKDTPGFTFHAEAVNKLDAVYGAFNFNLPLATQPEDVDETTFIWTESGREQRRRLSDRDDSFFRLPAADEMTIVTPRYSVRIGCEPAKTSGFYLDWSTAHLTPDLRGFYKKMRAGQQETVEWRFAAGENK